MTGCRKGLHHTAVVRVVTRAEEIIRNRHAQGQRERYGRLDLVYTQETVGGVLHMQQGVHEALGFRFRLGLGPGIGLEVWPALALALALALAPRLPVRDWLRSTSGSMPLPTCTVWSGSG